MRDAVTLLNFPYIGQNIALGVANGIRGSTWAITSAATAAAQAAFAAATAALDIHSPSRVGAWIGEMWDLGIAEGIDDNSRAVLDAAAGLNDLASLDMRSGSGGVSLRQGSQFDYSAMRDAVAEAITETGAGRSVITMDSRVVGETTEPWSSQATRRRSQQSVKGRTSRLVLV